MASLALEKRETRADIVVKGVLLRTTTACVCVRGGRPSTPTGRNGDNTAWKKFAAIQRRGVWWGASAEASFAAAGRNIKKVYFRERERCAWENGGR